MTSTVRVKDLTPESNPFTRQPASRRSRSPRGTRISSISTPHSNFAALASLSSSSYPTSSQLVATSTSSALTTASTIPMSPPLLLPGEKWLWPSGKTTHSGPFPTVLAIPNGSTSLKTPGVIFGVSNYAFRFAICGQHLCFPLSSISHFKSAASSKTGRMASQLFSRPVSVSLHEKDATPATSSLNSTATTVEESDDRIQTSTSPALASTSLISSTLTGELTVAHWLAISTFFCEELEFGLDASLTKLSLKLQKAVAKLLAAFKSPKGHFPQNRTETPTPKGKPFATLVDVLLKGFVHPLQVDLEVFHLVSHNSLFGICKTYPADLLVPFKISEKHALSQFAASFNLNRFPVLCWKATHCSGPPSLFRSAQRVASPTTLHSDILLLRDLGWNRRLCVVSLLPTGVRSMHTFSEQEQAYFETQFLRFHKYEVPSRERSLRAYHQLVETVLRQFPAVANHSSGKWEEITAALDWMTQLKTYFEITAYCASLLSDPKRRFSILLETQHGGGTAALISCLIQIVLDSNWRTVEGFCSLLLREFCCFGHRFKTFNRLLPNASPVYDLSPRFLALLHAVWNLWILAPDAFEFDQSLLVFLATESCGSLYSNFSFSSEKDLLDGKERLESIFEHVIHSPFQWTSPYRASLPFNTETLLEDTFDLGNSSLPVVFWNPLFLRWVSGSSLSSFRTPRSRAVIPMPALFSIQPERKQLYTAEHLFATLPPIHTLCESLDPDAITRLSFPSSGIAVLSAPWFQKLTLFAITHLDLSLNQISWLPPQISALEFLEELNLSENRICEFHEIPLPRLKSLNLSYNLLSHLDLLGCSELETLNVSGNQLSRFDLSASPNLVRLDLSFNRIDTLPRGLFSLKRLSAFDVSQNHLVSVQEFECNSLVSLKFLDLSFNKILFLPTAFLIEQLEFLFCQNNLLKIVPPSWIPQLSHLKDFNFDKNPILDSVKLELATSIASPTASPTLSTLSSSPPSSLALVDEEIQWPIVRTMIFGCGSTAQDQTSTYLIRKFASMLDRGSSSLQDVSTPSASEPDVIGWGRLASHFPSTPSVDITVQLIKIGRAKHCDIILEDTAVSSEHCEIVLEISGQKVDSAYCVDNSSNGTFINGKLIGKGNRKPLRSNDMISLCFPFSLENPLLPAAFTFSFFPVANIRQFLEASTKSETKQTRAVFCGIERCTIDVSSDLSVELIDFGGRPLWSPVLQFFLQPRAIYVITCNPASPSWQTDVEQALRQLVLKASLELRSPTALIAALYPVDLQEEQKRGLLQELQSARIFNTFSRVIKGRALVCPHTGDGIPALWDLILEQIKKSSKIVQPMVSSRWSLFSHILGHLRRHQCSSVSWGAFQDLLSGCRIDPQDYARVSAFFSETGSILLTRTDSLVIVDLPWIAGLMAMLVNEKRISSELQEGIVMHEDLHEIWPHLDQQPREAVVGLLARLEVVFSLRPLDRGIFVHLRLPSSSPSESEIAKLWPNGSTQFHRVYKFGFVPMRLFSRLLVRLYHVKRLEPKLVWQRGFIGGSSVVMLFVSYDETRNVLEARSRSLVEEAPVTPFLELIYLIDFLLEDIYPRALDQIERFAVCSHCLTSMHPKPSQFSLSALLVKFSRSGADAKVVCHSQILTPNFLPQDSDLAHLLELPTPSVPSSTSAPTPASTMPAPTSAIPVSASISGSISGFSAAPPSALSLTTILPHSSIPSCHLHPAPDSGASSLLSTLRPGTDMITSRTRAKSGGFGRILRKFAKQDPFHASLDIDISDPSAMIHAGHIGVDSQSGTMVVSSSELLSLVSQVSHAPVTVDSSTAAAAAMLTTVAATTAAQLHKTPVPLVSIAPDLVLPNLPRSGALQFGEELGVGGFGRVVKATNAAGTFVAVKEMLAMSQQQNNNSQSCSSTTVSLSGSTTNISDDTSSFSCDELASLEPLLTAMNGFLQESFVHGLLSHPNIVSFNGLFHHEDRLGMVLEFVSSGDLQNLLEPHRKASLLHSLAVTDLDRLVQVQVGPEEGSPPISVHIEEEQSTCYVIRTDTSRILVPKSAVRPSDRVPFTDAQLPWTFRIKMALDIAAAMHYLQQQSPPVIHRDLRSPNVFVRSVDISRASDPDYVHLKLADFGLARPVYSPLVGGLLPTFQWLAPEVIDTAALLYDEKSDIYSFGVVLWEIASRAVPFYSDYWTQFQTNGEFQKHLCIRAILKEDLRPKILDSTPPAFASLIQACWAHHPSARPPFEDIVPYLKRLLKASSDHLPLPHFRKKAHRQR